MRKLLLFIFVLVASFVFLAFAEDYSFEELMIFTGLCGFGINSILFIIWVMVSERNNSKLLVKLDDRGAVIRDKESEIKKVEGINLDLKAKLHTEKSLKESAVTSLRRKTEEDEVTIKLGDHVTPVKRYGKAKVYAIRLGDSGIQYQLREKGTWYSSSEIRLLDSKKTKGKKR